MKKITIQDIADELGISRNTVSKAINNAEGLADATRERILQKAVEMGYKQFSYVSTLAAAAASRPELRISSFTSFMWLADFISTYVPSPSRLPPIRCRAGTTRRVSSHSVRGRFRRAAAAQKEGTPLTRTTGYPSASKTCCR